MNQIEIFNSPEFGSIRTLEQNGKVLFCGTDVATALGYYIAGIKQPEIARREGIHSSKVSVAIHRGLRNMRRCYDVLFQTE